MPKLLLVDDEPNVLYTLELGLGDENLQIVTARTGKEALAAVREHSPDAVILDVRLPDGSGLDVFDAIREIDSRLPVIVITAFAASEIAIEATKRGAFEYLLKPVDLHQLRVVVERAIELRRMQTVPAVFTDGEPLPAADPIIGRSAAMQEVYKAIGRVAPQDVNVLLLGESGTGKELVARALFQHSKRADKPFLVINCAAIPEALLESELFGHEKGAFTGADRQRIGKFEQAHGGTVFLDEIGDMPASTQAKVLRVLQDQSFERVGGHETIVADVRVIAATNRRLDEMVAAAQFRQDLFYRLNGVTITLPPLRARLEDIPELLEYFTRLANEKLDKQVRSFSPEALRLIEQHSWPGNIRELQNVVRYAVLHAAGDVVTPECLPATLRGQPAAAPDSGETLDAALSRFVRRLLDAGEPNIYRRVLAELDRIVLAEVLRRVDGNQVHASELLGISRTTLRAKISATGLDRSGS